MNCCFIGDTHGCLINIKPCEVLFMCGDIVPLNIQSNSKKTRKWFRDSFIPWAKALPCNKVIIIPGNHDLHFKRKFFEGCDKIKCLINEEYDYIGSSKVIKIFGTPYCKIFGDWAYMISDDGLREKFSEIPDNVDILLTHDAPYGVSDIVMQSTHWNTGDHIGNKPLRDAIIEKRPKYCIHGHLHTTNHECEMLNDTKVYCCSFLDEFYEPSYMPLYLNI